MLRDHGGMGQPAWIGAATAAAVRLAAEAGADVDGILAHDLDPTTRAFQVTRFEQSADLPEVAADLAGMLWAECADVPLITTLLEEPAAQAALEAVAEARRQAAARLAGRDEPIRPAEPAPALTLVSTAVALDPRAADVRAVADPARADPALATPQATSATAAPHPSRRLQRAPILAGAVAAAVLLFNRRLRRV